ncbi:receptor-like protein EIX2 [Vigna unguiculata]|uniref:receptor-like protein EIX2 n=1 Tax=Vigna unguiculata TaxID=3917 RepID=UPI0010163729|nr:receptor-like protein EIX2 [Vigna unguiculata]
MTFISQFPVLLLLLIYAFTLQKIVCNNLNQVRCNEKDQQTLEIFKQGIIDPSNNLVTWSSEQDCCEWKGVHCDNTTSRVTKLDLSGQYLEGEIKLSLLELQFLYHLNLSYNSFDVISIPPVQNDVIFGSNLHYLDLYDNYDISMDNLVWLSQFSSLRYLNLGFINLRNATNWLHSLVMLPSLFDLRLPFCRLNITSSLKHVNFTSLVTIDLSANYITSKSLRWLFDLQRFSQLHSLKYLDLSGIDLHEETNWLLAMPPSLSYLYLSNCQLTNRSPSLKHVNLASLVTLDLSHNHFNSELPHWLFNLSHDLSHLDLKDSSLYGEIPSSFFNYQNLVYLDLSGNMFFGSIPLTLGNLTYLEYIDLSGNMFSGSIPLTLGNLTYLVSLSLSSNSFSGTIYSKVTFYFVDVELKNFICRTRKVLGPNSWY